MIIVHQIQKAEWETLAENAHLAIFGQDLPPCQERIDFALLSVDQAKDEILGYATCKELSPTALYLSYSGAFPPASKSILAWVCYKAGMEKLAQLGYTTIFTKIQNTNRGMLKMALKMGFKIVGIRHMDGCTMLEHVWEAT